MLSSSSLMKLGLVCILLSLLQLDTDLSWGTPCLAMWLPKERILASNKPHSAHFGGLISNGSATATKQTYLISTLQHLTAPYLLFLGSFTSFASAFLGTVTQLSSLWGLLSTIWAWTLFTHFVGFPTNKRRICRGGLVHSSPSYCMLGLLLQCTDSLCSQFKHTQCVFY